MKNSLVIIAILFVNLVFASEKKSAIPPQYKITKSVLDKTLKKTEAILIFTFKAEAIPPSKSHFDDEYPKPKPRPMDSSKVTTNNAPYKIMNQQIRIYYNDSNETIKTDFEGEIAFPIKPGKNLFRFYYTNEYSSVVTDSIDIKPGYQTWIEVVFKPSEDIAYPKKPVIYVYPEKTTNINIRLDVKGEMYFTYPTYNNGWDFIADADGSIHADSKTYRYLFWEGKTKINPADINYNEGFIVNKNNLVNFFEEKLSSMGLNSVEIADYITYWGPIMQENEYNYVHFIFNEEYNKYASINVTPQPDVMFRVMMLWSKVDSPNSIRLKEQILPSFTRKGFSLVEWGGMETNIFLNTNLSVK